MVGSVYKSEMFVLVDDIGYENWYSQSPPSIGGGADLLSSIMRMGLLESVDAHDRERSLILSH